MSERKPLLLRVSDALRALSSGGESTRTIVPTTYPNFPAGIQQMQLVRTADPTEYRRDGRTIRVQGFNAHPVVHACIRVVADIMASVPLVVLKERGDYESRVGDDHPLQKLLDYPGPRFTARQFRSRFAVDFLGYGNSFFVMERPGEGRPPIGLRAVNPESLQQVWIDTEGDPRRYDYANWAGLIVNVLTEDMLHFRDLEMGRPFEADVFGYPRGATAIGSLLADNEATQYVRQVVTNDGTPTFAVIMSDEATTEDAAAMQDRYRARVVDRGKRGTPAFFGAVKDIKPLGFTLSDLEFPDLRRVSREDICAAFGVDPRMIGIASASSDAGLSGIQYAEARARLVQHTIEPLFAAFEDELNHWLAPEFGDVWVTYDHDVLRDLVENDTETSTRIRAEYSEGLRTWEESRRAIKLSPLPEPTDSLLKVAGRDLIPAAVAVIDPRDVMTEAPATDNEAVPVPTDTPAPTTAGAAPTEDIQATALNGAQVTSLVEMLTMLANNQLPAQTVQALIKAAFPLVPQSLIDEMMAGITGFTPSAPATASAPSAPAQAEEEPEEEEGDEEEMDDDSEEEDTEEESKRSEPDEAEMRKLDYYNRAMQELDSTERTYKSTATSQLNSEKSQVVNAIRSAASADSAMAKVRTLYASNGEFTRQWQREFEPLISKTYQSGAKQVVGVGASIPAVLNDKSIRAKAKLIDKDPKKIAGVMAAPELKKAALTAIKNRTQRLAKYVGDTTSKEVMAAIRAAEQAGLSVDETARLVGRAIYGEERVDARTTMIARTEAAGAMSEGSWDQAKQEGDLFRFKEWLAFGDARDSHRDCARQGKIPIDDAFQNQLMYPLDPSGDADEVINCRCVLAYYDE